MQDPYLHLEANESDARSPLERLRLVEAYDSLRLVSAIPDVIKGAQMQAQVEPSDETQNVVPLKREQRKPSDINAVNAARQAVEQAFLTKERDDAKKTA